MCEKITLLLISFLITFATDMWPSLHFLVLAPQHYHTLLSSAMKRVLLLCNQFLKFYYHMLLTKMQCMLSFSRHFHTKKVSKYTPRLQLFRKLFLFQLRMKTIQRGTMKDTARYHEGHSPPDFDNTAVSCFQRLFSLVLFLSLFNYFATIATTATENGMQQ